MVFHPQSSGTDLMKGTARLCWTNTTYILNDVSALLVMFTILCLFPVSNSRQLRLSYSIYFLPLWRVLADKYIVSHHIIHSTPNFADSSALPHVNESFLSSVTNFRLLDQILAPTLNQSHLSQDNYHTTKQER